MTGGAGLYGRQIVQALAEAGAQDLHRLAEPGGPGERWRPSIAALGHDVRALRLDQGDEPSIFAVRDAIVEERAARLHVLVNNAVARPVKKGYFDDAAAIDESMRINGTGLILVTRALGEVMADGGSIINIGSMMGLVGLEPLELPRHRHGRLVSRLLLPQGRHGEPDPVPGQLLRAARHPRELRPSRRAADRRAIPRPS